MNKFYVPGFLFLCASGILMDSENLIVPIIVMCIGIVLICIGGWYEQRIIDRVNEIECFAHDYLERERNEKYREYQNDNS